MNDWQVDWKGFGLTFIILNIAIFISGAIGAKIGADRKRLEKRGYPQSYIRYTIDFQKKFVPRFFAVILLLEVFISFLVLAFGKKLGSSELLNYVFVPAVFFSIFFAAYYSTKANGDFKRLAMEEGHDIVVDFQHRFLKEIFSLPMEIAATLLVISYSVMYLSLKSSMILYLYIAMPWFFAATLILTKNYIRPMFRNSYLMIGKMTIIYQIILILLLYMSSLELLIEKRSALMLLLLVSITVLLIVKVVFYIPGFKRLKEKLDQL